MVTKCSKWLTMWLKALQNWVLTSEQSCNLNVCILCLYQPCVGSCTLSPLHHVTLGKKRMFASAEFFSVIYSRSNTFCQIKHSTVSGLDISAMHLPNPPFPINLEIWETCSLIGRAHNSSTLLLYLF
jgi:hypothetical protein